MYIGYPIKQLLCFLLQKVVEGIYTVDILREHLKVGTFGYLFKGNEYNNALRFLYTALASTVIDDADRFIIKTTHFEWYKNDVMIGDYLGKSAPVPRPSYSSNMHKIIERDEIVRKYTIIESETPEEMVISFKRRDLK
jgi:hypothetical protein